MRADNLIGVIDAEFAFVQDRLPYLHDEWRELQFEVNSLRMTLRLSRIAGAVPPVGDAIDVLRRFEPLLNVIEPEVVDPYPDTRQQPIAGPPAPDQSFPSALMFSSADEARDWMRRTIARVTAEGIQPHPTDAVLAEERRRQRELWG